MNEPLQEYLALLERALRAGNATEHTHRPAFKLLLETLFPGVEAVNEPGRIACGAPDYVLVRARPRMTLGYIEAKNVCVDLRNIESTPQLMRYRTLPNLVLTDFLALRWYVDGELRAAAALGEWDGTRVLPAPDGGAAALAVLEQFVTHEPAPVRSARALAEHLAPLTHQVRDIIVQALARDASQLLRLVLAAFRETLIPDLPEEQFADMYAQTITYGLFTARCNGSASAEFTRAAALSLIPHSNPFLRQIFQVVAGPNIDDEPYAGFVDDIIGLLAHADLPAIMADFGARTNREDPIVHFYETFLACYDPALREARGVYYTPSAAVNYIVRSVDALLADEFGLAAGLADTACAGGQPRVLILDPACGTGTFLYAVIEHIRRQFMQQQAGGQWAEYVRSHLIPRIFGFELLMAPYAVAHFKLALQLAGHDLPPDIRPHWSFAFDKKCRLNVFLTNTLEEAVRRSDIMFAQYLSDEANAAAAIKKDLPVMVVLGNPPYSNFGQMNRGEWILQLLEDYKRGLREKKLNLDDDFIKFIRWGQWRIERTGAGVLAFVTNNTYLDGITHRRMREVLREAFSDIYILNLHGNLRKQEECPGGQKDENIFDIQQGVAIALCVKNPKKKGPGRVHYADLWGSRADKYEYLDTHDVRRTRWRQLKPAREFFFFTPKDFSGVREYEQGMALTEIFVQYGCGVKTERDAVAIHWTEAETQQVVKDFKTLDASELRCKYGLGKDSRDWSIAGAQRDVRTHDTPECYRPILYRPFDVRHTWYSGQTRGFIGTPGYPTMQHLLAGPNRALITTRQTKYEFTALVTNMLADKSCANRLDICSVCPLYLYPVSKPASKSTGGVRAIKMMMLFEPPAPYATRRHNFTPAFVERLSAQLGMAFVPSGNGDLKKTFGPDDAFDYIYAVLHAPSYRARYAEFLKIAFPRIPLTKNAALFRALCGLGRELAALHLLQSPALDVCNHPLTSPVKYPRAGSDEIDRVEYRGGAVYINATQHFTPVPDAVWQFQTGGYHVCAKWLKDRKGRVLSPEDKIHYQKIITALGRTITLMHKIDQHIPAWPL